MSGEQQEALEALLAYPTKTAAAKALGISRPVLYRRLADPDLKEAYDEARHAAIADATESLQNVAEQAVAVPHTLANDPGVPARVRVTAASKILDWHSRLISWGICNREYMNYRGICRELLLSLQLAVLNLEVREVE